MAIQVTCSGCGATFNVDEKHIGKTGKCAKCGNRVPIVPVLDEEEEEPLVTHVELPPLPPKPNRPPRRASEKQKAYAADLGIVFDENITSREISKLINAALAREDGIDYGEIQIEKYLKTLNKCEPSDMVDAMQKRGMCAFMFYWSPQEARTENDFDVNISFSDNLTERQVHKMAIRHVVRLAMLHKVPSLPDLLAMYIDK